MTRGEKDKTMPDYTEEQLRVFYMVAARTALQTDDLEIDDDATISLVDEEEGTPGAWVQAWVWVAKDQVPELANES
jgi:hypothetical protein